MIDIRLDIDLAKGYVQAKADGYMNDMISELKVVLNKHDPWRN